MKLENSFFIIQTRFFPSMHRVKWFHFIVTPNIYLVTLVTMGNISTADEPGGLKHV